MPDAPGTGAESDPVAARIRDFLAAGPFAVAGASTDRAKYGNKVLRAYQQRGLEVHPLHPRERSIEGLPCAPAILALPVRPRALSIVTPPPVTEALVEEAAAAGVKHVWMQPGAESAKALERAEALGLSVIAGGPCILVVLGYRES
jgi:predicted CoA-binding protein